jgi:hypothetical protein
MCTTGITAMAQKDSKKPRWIKLMHDPSANYFETVKAFDKYWKTREEPEEEGERKENERRTKKKKRKDLYLDQYLSPKKKKKNK